MASQRQVAEAPNIWAVAQQQFDQAAAKLDLDAVFVASFGFPSGS